MLAWLTAAPAMIIPAASQSPGLVEASRTSTEVMVESRGVK
jgi:hypothetical protein